MLFLYCLVNCLVFNTRVCCMGNRKCSFCLVVGTCCLRYIVRFTLFVCKLNDDDDDDNVPYNVIMYQLPENSAHLSDCNFITHVLYKSTY